MKIPIYQIDAFADAPFTGNPAAVCPLDSWPGDELLQSIALENNLSETAFLVGGEGRYQLRWFTPACEVDLCGHATLASAHVVFNRLEPSLREVCFSSRSGDLAVSRDGDNLSMRFPLLSCTPCPVPEGLEGALGVEVEEAFDAEDMMVTVRDAETLRRIEPDFDFIASRLPRRGLIVTAAGDDCDFVSRFFGPAVGIPEDPVTGSAHCISAPYWARRLGKEQLLARQLSKRGGTVTCGIDGDRVILGGRAILFLEGTIVL